MTTLWRYNNDDDENNDDDDEKKGGKREVGNRRRRQRSSTYHDGTFSLASTLGSSVAGGYAYTDGLAFEVNVVLGT